MDTVETLRAERDELYRQLHDREAMLPVEEVQRFVTVSSVIARSNNVASAATALRVHVVPLMIVMVIGMIFRCNPWYVAWTMLALTVLHSTYMWWVASRWQLRARQADTEFASWSSNRSV